MMKFSAQTTNEQPVLTMDFSQRLAGRTIASCEVTAEMYEQTNATDPDPGATLNGDATLNADAFEYVDATGEAITVPPGAAVMQAIASGRTLDATYLYRFFAVCTDGSKMEEDATQTVTQYSEP